MKEIKYLIGCIAVIVLILSVVFYFAPNFGIHKENTSRVEFAIYTSDSYMNTSNLNLSTYNYTQLQKNSVYDMLKSKEVNSSV